jgi:hypothetical protein
MHSLYSQIRALSSLIVESGCSAGHHLRNSSEASESDAWLLLIGNQATARFDSRRKSIEMTWLRTVAGKGGYPMLRVRILLGIVIVFGVLASAHGQDQDNYNKFRFNIGGGISFPQGDLGSFVNDGANFVVGGGYNFTRILGVDSEFMWADLPINQATKNLLATTGASARQYAWTFNPIVQLPIGHKLGAYAIGGIGWYHRSGETTTPGVGVVCDPYWSWWYGCTLGTVNFVTGSHSGNAFGENIGAGVTFRLGESHAKIYAEFRYHHAGYDRVSTNLIPLTFGIRW